MENNNASAPDLEPKEGSEALATKPEPAPGKIAVNSQGVEVSKWSIRKKIWEHMEEKDLVNFPRPCTNRIPNFVDASIAADKMAELDEFKKARTVKINPDKPQEHARFLTLEAKKTLLVPTPRLRTGLFNRITPPEDANKEILRKCSTALGVKEHSKKISLKDKVTIDLVVVGSVAVSKEGFRLGKGEGFADLEYAMMATMEAVSPDTVVVTTVHDDQIVEIPEELVEDHDLTVDYIITPTQVIKTGCKRPKPTGIIWSDLEYEKLYRIPVLRKLREFERDNGKDVRLKGQDQDDDDFEERMDQERRERGYRGRGGRGGMRRPFRSRRGGIRMGGRPRRYRQDDSADQGDESNKENAEESNDNEGGSGGERGGRRRRFYRNRGYRRNKPSRQSESELSDGVERGDHEGEDDIKENRRPPPRQRRFRNRRGMGRRSDNSGDNTASDGENRRSDGDENRPPRPRRPRIETSPDGVVFVGGISRRLRVSEFKMEMRGCDVHPVRLVWRGGRGFAFLHFQSADNANTAVKALAGLEIDGRELNVELARQDNRPRRKGRNPKEVGSSESANQESVGSSDVAVEGAER